jgi:hypothetical protein
MTTLDHPGLEQVDEHTRAQRQLTAAMEEQQRLAATYEDSIGTTRELPAYMRLREARKRVDACDKWLHWVDDEDVVPAPAGDELPLEEDDSP